MKQNKLNKKIRRLRRKQLYLYKLIQIQQKKKWKRERKIARLRGELVHLFFEGAIKLYSNLDSFPIETLVAGIDTSKLDNETYIWKIKDNTIEYIKPK
jgi:hypothetical protein